MSRDIDVEARAELQEFFSNCDLDQDGRIQRGEFAELLKNLGSEMSAEEVAIGFAEIDQNGNGTIDFSEFVAYWSER